MPGSPFDPGAVQLPRGPNGRALIGDPRNDENRIVAQLHAIFLRFHNRVVDHLGGKQQVSFDECAHRSDGTTSGSLSTTSCPRSCRRRSTPASSRAPGRLRRCGSPGEQPRAHAGGILRGRLPFRALHGPSRYKLNEAIERPIFGDPGDDAADLGGSRPIPANWAIDWRLFIDLGHDAGPAPQLSYKIDTSLARSARPPAPPNCQGSVEPGAAQPRAPTVGLTFPVTQTHRQPEKREGRSRWQFHAG